MKCRMIFSMVAMFSIFLGTAFAVNVRDVVFTTKGAGKVVFSHGVHINKNAMANNCRACHDAVFNLKKKKHYSMADMKQGKSCGACHNGTQAFGVDRCAACHNVNEITYQVKQTGPTLFSHKKHLAVVACGACHPVLYAPNRQNKRVGMVAMEKGKSCGACHNSKQAFSVKECSKCHPVRELVYEEKSTGNIAFSHKIHSGLYTCADCHAVLYKTIRSKVKVSMQEMEKGKSCGMCHNGNTAFSVKETCELCHKM